MFSVCEIPPSPWQPIHNSAFALPAAMSAAWANDPQTIAPISIPNKAIRITIPLDCHFFIVVAQATSCVAGNPTLERRHYLDECLDRPGFSRRGGFVRILNR